MLRPFLASAAALGLIVILGPTLVSLMSRLGWETVNTTTAATPRPIASSAKPARPSSLARSVWPASTSSREPSPCGRSGFLSTESASWSDGARSAR